MRLSLQLYTGLFILQLGKLVSGQIPAANNYQNDLIILKKAFEENYPSLYRFNSKSFIDQLFEKGSKEIDGTTDDGAMRGAMELRTIVRSTPEPVVEYDENGIAIPTKLQSKAFPNPATTSTTLEIGLPQNDFMEISLYDLNGQFIRSVFSGDLKRGTRNFPVDLMDVPAGMYLFVIHSKNYSGTTRIIKV